MLEEKEFNHVSVMGSEAIDYLNINPEGIYVDCTLGRAGHSELILKKLTTGKLIAFDQDQKAISESQQKLQKYKSKYILVKSNFSCLEEKLKELNILTVDGIFYDLGISSPQVDEISRGFSYKNDSKLDMRMDEEQELSAFEVVNSFSFQQLKDIIKNYGEEKFANSIVKNIILTREKEVINSTQQLVDIIKKSIPNKFLKEMNHHPAKKTFQALRIYVNDELNSLQSSLNQAVKLIKKNGRVVVISFHSLEDRIVKQTFQKLLIDPNHLVYSKIPINNNWKSSYKIITKKPILPTDSEIKANPRARSAKLRAIEKIF